MFMGVGSLLLVVVTLIIVVMTMGVATTLGVNCGGGGHNNSVIGDVGSRCVDVGGDCSDGKLEFMVVMVLMVVI